MNLTLYSFSKKQNSTAVPTGGTPITCYFKDNTSIINPTFVIESSTLNLNVNYCYLQETSRYYFVRDIVCRHEKIYELVCEIDALASFKSQILNTSAYVLFSAQGSTSIPDARMTTTKDYVVGVSNESFPMAVGGNNYFISTTGVDGVETYYVIRSDVASLFDSLVFDPVTVTQGADENATLAAVGNAIGQAVEQMFTQGTVMNNLRSAYVLPFPVNEECLGAAKNITAGFYDTNVEGDPLVESIYSFAVAISIPWQVSDWRRCEPYSVVCLYLPFFGVQTLDTNGLVNSSYVTVKYSICYSNGDLSYSVETDTHRIIATGTCNVRAEWGIGSSNAGNAVNNAIGLAAADIAGWSGEASKIPFIGKAVGGTLSSIGNSLAGAVQSFVKGASTSGGLGGFSDSGLETRIYCWAITKTFSDTQTNFATKCGYPVYAVQSLAGKSGFLQTNGFQMDGSATSAERDIINMMMDTGIYIE